MVENGSGGVEVPVEKMRVERSVQEKTKKKNEKKERKNEPAKKEIRGS